MKILILLLITVSVSVAILSPQEKDFVSIALSVQASKVLGSAVNSDGIAATEDIADGAIEFDDTSTKVVVNDVELSCPVTDINLEDVDIGGDENCL